jgi:hypothetical protein
MSLSVLFDELRLQREIRLYRYRLSELAKALDVHGEHLIGPGDIKVDGRKYSQCNVWGSGWSVKHSILSDRVGENTYDIGFGFSCLNNVKYDLYFIENASPDMRELVFAQKSALYKFVVRHDCPIILKNLWQEKNDIDYAATAYEGLPILFGRDLIIPHKLNTKSSYRRYSKVLTQHDDTYFRQACSTVLTAIIFAVNKGFTRIVVHGIDFGGGYFFDDDASVPSDVIPPVVSDVYDSSWRKKDARHPTGDCLKMFLFSLKQTLAERGITLLAGVKESPSSEVLGVDQ